MATQPTPESNEDYIKEIEEGRVIDNLVLLTLWLDLSKRGEQIDPLTGERLRGVQTEVRLPATPEGVEEAMITITYNTRTGEIGPISGKLLGDYSRLRTSLIGKGGHQTILLHRPGDSPSVAQMSAALANETLDPGLESRRIMPERVSSQHPKLVGVHEVWGSSQYVDSARGDLVILRTIRKFNETFGPPR